MNNNDLYASTRRSATAHSEQRTENRRLAVLASIRATRNFGRVWNVAALIVGAALAAMLSGFGLWPPILTVASITAALVLTIGTTWAGAVLLPRPAAGLAWFAVPLIAGVVSAAVAGQWLAFAILMVCMLLSLGSLAAYQKDGRRGT